MTSLTDARGNIDPPSQVPKRKPKDPAEGNLAAGVRWSIALHVLLAILIVVKSFVWPGEPLDYVPTLRVDLVGLPDILKKDLMQIPPLPAQPEVKEPPKEVPKEEPVVEPAKPEPKVAAKVEEERADPDEMVLKQKTVEKKAPQDDRKKKNMSALERIKNLERLDKIKNEVAAPAVIKGNQVSRGTSLSADAREAMEASYLDVIRDRIQRNWALSPWLARQSLAAQVLIVIDGRGMVRRLAFVKNSGNEQFDAAVKKAVLDSQPFPQPPEEAKSWVSVDGVTVGFPL